MIPFDSGIGLKALIAALLAATCCLVEAESVVLTVVQVGSPIERTIPSRLEATIAAGVEAEGTHKIRFYRTLVPVRLAGTEGKLAWFSYTNPPKDKHWIHIEADMPVYGGFINQSRLYVCSPTSGEDSVPVLNAFLRAIPVEKLSDVEARDFALLSGQCMGAGQIYGHTEQIADPIGRELLARVAAPPTVGVSEHQTIVVFYSWDALKGSVMKWSFVYRAAQVHSIRVENVPGGQLLLTPKRR